MSAGAISSFFENTPQNFVFDKANEGSGHATGTIKIECQGT